MHSDIHQTGVVDESLDISRSVHPIYSHVLDLCSCVFRNFATEFHNSSNIVWVTGWLADEINVICKLC